MELKMHFGIYLNAIYIILAGFLVLETYFLLKLHFKQILKHKKSTVKFT